MTFDPRASHERLRRAARAAHELSDVLWESLEGELDGPGAERVGEMSRRLADICSTIALLAETPAEAPADAPPTAPAPVPAPASGVSEPPASPLEPPEPAPEATIAVHDARREEGPTAWIGSIGRRLERHREDRLPFAVLLIEVLDIDRLADAQSAPELSRLTALVERAIGDQLRPADLLTRESLGRYWLVTPETDPHGARILAERLARTVRASGSHRGVPLEVAIGIAVCPDDGLDPSALAAHADVGVYAARASGQPLAPGPDPAA